jgi:PqqD family protein of HPr-rel-A system
LAARHYAIAAETRVCIFDDEAIVFNPFSWETHLLNPAAALVLESAASGPLTEAGVSELLGEVLDERQRPRAAEHARLLLQELIALRLLVEQRREFNAGC